MHPGPATAPVSLGPGWATSAPLALGYSCRALFLVRTTRRMGGEILSLLFSIKAHKAHLQSGGAEAHMEADEMN